ncbi:Trm112 family protein [Psychromonas sp. MME2]|uniref:Trm112 family protein n=1 Tax=unclassified Psychromonas TaxID=2614957 RepID=UPI00339CA727
MLDIKLFDIIACPVCKGKLGFNKNNNELICKFDHLAYPIEDGIPALLHNRARKISCDEER